jgi:hypothetical protein
MVIQNFVIRQHPVIDMVFDNVEHEWVVPWAMVERTEARKPKEEPPKIEDNSQPKDVSPTL